MRRSPTRPLILKRRKLPFHQNATDSQPGESGSKEPSKPAATQSFSDGIRIMDHPSMSDTQVVVIPETAEVQSVIGALTAKDNECGAQGPNKLILLSGSGSDNKSTEGHKVKDVTCNPLDDSLGRMSTCDLEPNSTNADAPQQPISERPPYSYMAMIQFAINSRKNRRMTLKEIYMWIEDNFSYYRDVAKPGWKNSIRHNLSLHDLFIRETSPDGKMSFWTIRHEANRYLTLDHVYKPGRDPMTATVPVPMLLLANQVRLIYPFLYFFLVLQEKKMKPLPPQTDSCFVLIQLPVTPSVYLPSTSCSQQNGNNSRAAKRVRIAPKVRNFSYISVEVKEELVCVPIKCETPKAPPKRQASSSQCKQRLVHSVNEEPVLLCHESNFFDSGVACDASTFHLTLSTPSKMPSYVASFKVTQVGKESQNILHLSPIHTRGGFLTIESEAVGVGRNF
uniref:Forkhead box protein M1 n=2 Tax=Oreochromis TaxID=8139 RepID=A0A669BK81_ORENI